MQGKVNELPKDHKFRLRTVKGLAERIACVRGERRVGALHDPVDGCDIRMVQRRQHLRFVFEERHVLGIAVGSTLMATSRFSLQERARHTSHSPGAEWRNDFVRAELITRR